MCNIKEGANVKTKGDLQNLVTSVFLRQESCFSVEDIYNGVLVRLKGSDWYDSPEVKQRCEDTLSTLFINGCIRGDGHGKYKLSMSFPSVVPR
jgi:hypothetical protein